jgi:hypothetical protein
VAPEGVPTCLRPPTIRAPPRLSAAGHPVPTPKIAIGAEIPMIAYGRFVLKLLKSIAEEAIDICIDMQKMSTRQE